MKEKNITREIESVNVSNNICILNVGEDSYIIWNRFYPSILKINKKAIDFIYSIKKGEIKPKKGNQSFIDLLLKYKILYKGNSDPSRKNFRRSIHNQLIEINKNAEKFYGEERDYNKLVIVNDHCNLSCSYCIKSHKNPYQLRVTSPGQRLEIVINCVDQFLQRKVKNNVNKTKISLNGGEILLNWKLIKEVIEWISKRYDIEIEYSLTTNMTLMTEEIAKFLSGYNFKAYVSIDGYKEINEKTRVYKNGDGTFEDIIRGIEIFRKYNKYQIEGFQGTIDIANAFDPEKVYQMKDYGFNSARLAPNLLNTTTSDALKKAEIMGKFMELNPKNSFLVTETYFENMKKLINQDTYNFLFNCKGLCCYPELDLNLNISTLRLSHLCSYVPLGSLSYDELNGDIYNPALWKQSSAIIKGRIKALLDKCDQCDLIGICRGGCIYSGLDKENQVNEAACAYQEKIWELYVKNAYRESMTKEK